jgi:cell division protease FtsH
MHADLGSIVYEEPRRAFLEVPGLEPPARNYSEDTARAIDKAVRQLVDAAFAQSIGLLQARRSALETGARRLLEKETLTDVDLRELLREAEPSPPAAPAEAAAVAGSVAGHGTDPATASGASATGGESRTA